MSLGVRKINLRKLSQSSKGSKKFWPKPKNDSDLVSGLENDQPQKVNDEREIIYSKISAVASPLPLPLYYPCIAAPGRR